MDIGTQARYGNREAFEMANALKAEQRRRLRAFPVGKGFSAHNRACRALGESSGEHATKGSSM